MTDKQAERVSQLIQQKKELLDHVGFIDSTSIQWQLNYRVKTGMYQGYPFEVLPERYQMTEKEIGDFIASKLRGKLEQINRELENY